MSKWVKVNPKTPTLLHLSADVGRSFRHRSGSAQSGTKSVLLIFNDGDAGERTEWPVTAFSCTSLNISNCVVCNCSYYLNNKTSLVCYGLIFQGLCSPVGGAGLGGVSLLHQFVSSYSILITTPLSASHGPSS